MKICPVCKGLGMEIISEDKDTGHIELGAGLCPNNCVGGYIEE